MPKQTRNDPEKKKTARLFSQFYRLRVAGKFARISVNEQELYHTRVGLCILAVDVCFFARLAVDNDRCCVRFLVVITNRDAIARDPQAVELRKKALELAKDGKLPDGWEGV